MGYLTMNHKEREQAKVFEQVKQGIITQNEAAARLRITARWVRAKIKRYYQFDDIGLVHKNRGRVSPRRWDAEKEQFLIELLQGNWHGFGPTFAAEKLEELHDIKVSKEVVRKAMIRAGIWKPKQKRNMHRKRRERKQMLGMMVQLDGSPHDWFEGRAEKCTLLVYIDDATSRILWLEFADAETITALMQATKNYVEKHGIPGSFYTDHGSVFHVNVSNLENIRKTQWELACKQLGIKVQHAHSPQAKGRVERCNETMQDRLIKELRLADISSIAAANDFLRTSNFIPKHNAKFAVQPAQKGNAHSDASPYDLSAIFCLQEVRLLANDFTIVYKKRIFQLHSKQRRYIKPKDKIIIKTYLNGTLTLWFKEMELSFHEIFARPIREREVTTPIPRKPSRNSYLWNGGRPESILKPAAPAVEAI